MASAEDMAERDNYSPSAAAKPGWQRKLPRTRLTQSVAGATDRRKRRRRALPEAPPSQPFRNLPPGMVSIPYQRRREAFSHWPETMATPSVRASTQPRRVNPRTVAPGGTMNFDFSALDTATYVFIGTLVFAAILVAFIAAAALATIILIGAMGIAWYAIKAVLGGLVHGINFAWDRVVHHAGQVEIPAEFQPQVSPSTGSYSRVALRDS